ncbi:fatty acid desaturase, partial [Hamiltosporidium tvaerminnensis]
LKDITNKEKEESNKKESVSNKSKEFINDRLNTTSKESINDKVSNKSKESINEPSMNNKKSINKVLTDSRESINEPGSKSKESINEPSMNNKKEKKKVLTDSKESINKVPTNSNNSKNKLSTNKKKEINEQTDGKKEIKNKKNILKPEKEDNKKIIYDERSGDFKGFWKKSIPYKDRTFAYDTYDEPHIKRKRIILKKYPQISNLYGYSKKTKYIILISVFLFLCGTYFCTFYIKKWYLFLLFSYIYGGSFSALSGILIHECSHNLAAKSQLENRILGFISNIMLIIPISGSFKKYHLDHHAFLGVKDKDPDLPLDLEIKLVEGNKFMKIFYIIIYPVFYVIRSTFIRKKITKEEIINLGTHIIFILLIFHFMGIKAIGFIACSSWLGYSIHPAAAHLIQEHFTFSDGQETYSYYGSLNKVFLNIGYHNEHHDFMAIPWDKLPQVNQIANEYYSRFNRHFSWFSILYRFVVEDVYGPQSRVARPLDIHMAARKYKIRELEENIGMEYRNRLYEWSIEMDYMNGV